MKIEEIVTLIKGKNNLHINKNGKDLKHFFEEVVRELRDINVLAILREGYRVDFSIGTGGPGNPFFKITPKMRYGTKDVVIIYGEVDERWVEELREYISGTEQVFVKVSDSDTPRFVENCAYLVL